jgi:uncharacterized membrane protein YciS (DUF1049 family)
MNKRDNTLVWVCFALLFCIFIQMVGTFQLKSEIKNLESQIKQLKTHEVHK